LGSPASGEPKICGLTVSKSDGFHSIGFPSEWGVSLLKPIWRRVSSRHLRGEALNRNIELLETDANRLKPLPGKASRADAI